MFITFYGVNNIGKTTQTKELTKILESQGYKVKLLKYPIYDLEPTGPFINHQLRGNGGQSVSEEELQMWYVLNRMGFEPQLKDLIATHDIVIAEDYIETGITWGTAKGASEEWLEEINRYLLEEDLKILLVGKRIKTAVEDGHIHENNDQLTEVCGNVLLKRAHEGGWLIIEVQPTIHETAELIWNTVKRYLP